MGTRLAQHGSAAIQPQRPTWDFTFDQVWQMANKIAQAGLFGMRRPEEAFSLMLVAQAEGKHPAIACREFHIIQGKASMSADAMLARFQAAGGKVRWHEYTDAKADATFIDPVGNELRIDWDMNRAARAGLSNRDNWRHYPRAMLRSKVICEGVTTLMPGVKCGMPTPEDLIERDGILADPIGIDPHRPSPSPDRRVIESDTIDALVEAREDAEPEQVSDPVEVVEEPSEPEPQAEAESTPTGSSKEKSITELLTECYRLENGLTPASAVPRGDLVEWRVSVWPNITKDSRTWNAQVQHDMRLAVEQRIQEHLDDIAASEAFGEANARDLLPLEEDSDGD